MTGHEPLGDAVGALGAQPGQGVAHLGVGEALDELAPVGVEVDPGHLGQGRAALVLHVAEQEVDEERVLADLVRVAVAGEVAEVAERLVAGVEQPQLHQLVGHDVVDELHAGVLEGRPAVGEVVLEHPLGERLAHDRPAVLDPERRRRAARCPPAPSPG